MPSGGRRLPPWTSPRSAGAGAPRWSPAAAGTPAGGAGGGPGSGYGTPPVSAGGCGFGTRVTPPTSGGGGARVTPPSTGGGASRPPRPPPNSLDSPYVRAKQAQVIEKDPNKAVPLFWAAINSGDRIESALKDMANVLKQANRTEEAIEAIRSFRDRCPYEAQESLDNILLDLYKKCGRTEEQIEMLTIKLRIVDEELASGRWKTKLSKSHGRVVYLSLRDEKARLLGNLAWAYMQSENYEEAEMLYRQALAIEADYNKECNLAICLMKTGKLTEAKYLLQAIPYNCDYESHVKSLSRATEMLRELELQSLPSPITQMKSKESRALPAADVEMLEDPRPQTVSTPLSELKYKEPHISVSPNAEKHENCSSWPSPITQLKREEPRILVTVDAEKNEGCAGFQDLSQLFNGAATPHSILEKLRKRLVKEAPTISIHDQIQTPIPTECLPNSDGNQDASENSVQGGKLLTEGVRKTWADMVDEEEQQLGEDKPWADMVAKDEQQLGNDKLTVGVGTTEHTESSKHAIKQEYRTPPPFQGSSTFHGPLMGGHQQGSSANSWRHSNSKISKDNKVNWDLVRTAPTWSKHKVQDHSDRVCQSPNTAHLNEDASGNKQAPWRSSASQRALFPDWKSKGEGYGHGYVPFGDNEHSQGSSHTGATHRWHNNAAGTVSWRPQNRLRVFQEITNEINQNVV
ncbi:Protein POLLENLESS 3-LIKE 2 [Dichanthelium oligosanthes]|uniref:Protein POLLENLESS 3-LIKE 2 n=1 Tax=Dichanthelium oligosanthes TaxID=888268 RepID=A0A1E5WMM6_9POAL|nr:Protein POLLENLESS 3-LIKE 2 [Dichanthelium oligosanthes]